MVNCLEDGDPVLATVWMACVRAAYFLVKLLGWRAAHIGVRMHSPPVGGWHSPLGGSRQE